MNYLIQGLKSTPKYLFLYYTNNRLLSSFLFHPSFIQTLGRRPNPPFSRNMEWCKWSNVITLLRTIFITALFALFVQQSVTALIKFLDGKTSYHITLKVNTPLTQYSPIYQLCLCWGYFVCRKGTPWSTPQWQSVRSTRLITILTTSFWTSPSPWRRWWKPPKICPGMWRHGCILTRST